MKRSVVILLVIVVSLRLIIFALLCKDPSHFLAPDSIYSYIPIAKNLITNGRFSEALNPPYLPDLKRTPLYPLILALFFQIFGDIVYPVIILQILLSAVIVYLAYSIGRDRFGEKVGLITSYLFGLDPTFIALSLYVLTETVFIFFLLLFLKFYLSSLKNGRAKHPLLSGMFLALATLTRPISFYLPIIALAFYLFKDRLNIRKSLYFFSIYLLVIAPWLYRNYRISGRVIISSIPHYNLLIYNAASVEAELKNIRVENFYKDPKIVRLRDSLKSYADSVAHFNNVPEFFVNKKVALKIIKKHPLLYLKIHLKGSCSV